MKTNSHFPCLDMLYLHVIFLDCQTLTYVGMLEVSTLDTLTLYSKLTIIFVPTPCCQCAKIEYLFTLELEGP